jgi:catechol 2,3-dioxygenase-like lactoylglutathione lyase family enzyme
MTGSPRIDHVGLTVPDIEEAIRFFGTLAGFKELYRIGPLTEDDSWMTTNLNVEAGTRLDIVAMLGSAGGTTLELFQYRSSDQRREPPRNSDVGGNHVAFHVDDIEAAAARLAGLGARINGEVKHISEGPLAGLRWLYFCTPWGQQLELVSYPEGLAYARRGN